MSDRRPRLALVAVGASIFVGLALVPAAPASGASTLPPPAVAEEVPATAVDLTIGNAENSPMLLADPTEARFVVLAHRTDAPAFGCGLQVSGDGGRSWVPANPVPTLPEGAEVCYAPEIAFDRGGKLYYMFIGLAGLGNNPVGVYLTTSDNHGQSFSAPQLLLGPSNYQARMAIDPTIGSAGRIHLVWLKAASDSLLGGLAPEPNPLFSAYSDDGGRTFSEPVQVSDPSRARVVAPAIAVGKDHAVHIAYFDLQDDARDYQGLEGPPWDGSWSVVTTTSFDRGRHFGPGVVVDDKLVPPGRVMLIYTMPPPTLVADSDGAVQVAWSDSRRGDPDVFLARSGDGGRSWQPPQRVNDDAAGNGRDQYLPRLGLATTGRLDMVFLDRREDPENVHNDVYYTYSENGGPFVPNIKLTRRPSNSYIGQTYEVPSAKGLVELGGRLGLLSQPAYAVAAWPDTRNGLAGDPSQSVFTTAVTFPGLSNPDSGGSSLPVIPLAVGAVVLVGLVGTFFMRRRPKAPSDVLQ